MSDARYPARVLVIRNRLAALAPRLDALRIDYLKHEHEWPRLDRQSFGDAVDELERYALVLSNALRLLSALGCRYATTLPPLCELAEQVLSEAEALLASLEVRRAAL